MPESTYKVRFRYSKLGKVRWTSHRDVARMWERALRRGGVPIAYTAGFSPRPQLSFGLALPTGCESLAEYVDATLREVEPSEQLSAELLVPTLSSALPAGVEVQTAVHLESGSPSLQEDVVACTWEIEVAMPSTELETAIGRVLSAGTLPITRERKGRVEVDDLRPSLLALACGASTADRAVIVAETATRPRGVRPDELAEVLGAKFERVRRTSQWIERDGSRREPLSVESPSGCCTPEPVS